MAAMSEFQKQLKIMPGQALIMTIWGYNQNEVQKWITSRDSRQIGKT